MAELSHNHCGSVYLAEQMIRLAAESGADAVKMQKRGTSTYAGLRGAGEAEYAALRESRELTPDEYKYLVDKAHGYGVLFAATVFDPESLDALADVDLDIVKIASGDCVNLPLLRYVAGLGKPLLVSTGGCEMADVIAAFDTLRDAGAQFALLHCTSEYPVRTDRINLNVIRWLRWAFPEVVAGFSSHVHRVDGHTYEAIAYALGARIIERHFTITPGIDTGEHAFGVTPLELAQMCDALRVLPSALGTGAKYVQAGEEAGIKRLGKHLVWANSLKAGDVVMPADLLVMGGGVGVAPNRMSEIVGATLSRSVQVGEDVEAADVEALCQTA